MGSSFSPQPVFSVYPGLVVLPQTCIKFRIWKHQTMSNTSIRPAVCPHLQKGLETLGFHAIKRNSVTPPCHFFATYSIPSWWSISCFLSFFRCILWCPMWVSELKSELWTLKAVVSIRVHWFSRDRWSMFSYVSDFCFFFWKEEYMSVHLYSSFAFGEVLLTEHSVLTNSCTMFVCCE